MTSLVPKVLHKVVSQFPSVFESAINHKYKNLFLVTSLACSALVLIKKFYESNSRYKEGCRDFTARVLLKIPAVKKAYQNELKKKMPDFSKKFRSEWEKFGAPFREIPNQGLSAKEIIEKLITWNNITVDKLKDTHVSGTLYGPTLVSSDRAILLNEGAEISGIELQSSSYAVDLARSQEKIFDVISKLFRFYNSLHDEFSIGNFATYQVTQMVGAMFGGESNEIMGMVTSGGTASIMEAVLMYRKRAEDLGYIKLGEGVILGSETMHAAFEKAAGDYHVRVDKVKSNQDGTINLKTLEEKLKKHRKKVICIVASAPNYSTGTIDPIHKISELAKKYDCRIHVDACLGGFIVNYLPGVDANYFKLPNVTSVSCDTHKNGGAPKGNSVLVVKSSDGENLMEYGVRTVPDWDGGRYATLGLEGSRSLVPDLQAFAAILFTGQDGYREIAQNIREKVKELEKYLIDEGFEIIGKPECNVVAFKMNDKDFVLGSTHELANQMKIEEIALNKLSKDRVHFCVTSRFVSDPEAIGKFKDALNKAKREVSALNERGEIKIRDDDGAYFAIESRYSPELGKSESFTDYLVDLIFGRMVANSALTSHFMGIANPYN